MHTIESLTTISGGLLVGEDGRCVQLCFLRDDCTKRRFGCQTTRTKLLDASGRAAENLTKAVIYAAFKQGLYFAVKIL